MKTLLLFLLNFWKKKEWVFVEGRFEEEGSSKDNSFRLIYGENVFDEEKALRLLGTHLVDADIGTYFFNDAQRMHRDLLSDAAEAIIGKKIKSKEIVPLQ